MRKMLGPMRRYFDRQEVLRERVLGLSRQVVRASARAIAAMHRGDQDIVRKMLKDAEASLVELKRAVRSDPTWTASGMVHSAQQEYSEARLLDGFLRRGRLLQPRELKVPYRPYLGGLADVAGELRRYTLDSIRADHVAEADRALKMMEDIHELLMSFDYPDVILPSMKRKQDMVRGVLDRTRGDLTTAMRQQRLERALERVKRRKR